MTREDLLKPRYKVIADFPLAYVAIGEILNGEVGSVVEGGYWRTEYAKYPHLFKKLEWWQERELSQMPEYLKRGERVFKVETLPNGLFNYGFRGGTAMLEGKNFIHLKSTEPATLEEYQTSLK